MRATATALYSFWSSFGIPAYVEGYVPDDAVEPYITYELKKPNWTSLTVTTTRVWYRDTSYIGITGKVDEIGERIGEGVLISCGEGFLQLFKDDEFVQFQPYEADDSVKVAYLSMTMENNNK
jgi:hypothetical protein